MRTPCTPDESAEGSKAAEEVAFTSLKGNEGRAPTPREFSQGKLAGRKEGDSRQCGSVVGDSEKFTLKDAGLWADVARLYKT